MEEKDAIGALVGDLNWQIEQMRPRNIKDSAGNPYTPSYYKRGLKNAVDRGGLAVAEFVRGYLYRSPSGGYKKLEDADSLDLTCEALVADDSKPYAHLFTDEDRAAARKRLAPHIAAIEARKADVRDRIAAKGEGLSGDLDTLQAKATEDLEPEVAVAVNQAILDQEPDDVVALIRLSRAHEALGHLEEAKEALEAALAADPKNTIAQGRLGRLERRIR